MNDKWKDENTELLFQAMLTMKTTEELSCFFEDLSTVTELKAMAQRFAVAKMLDEQRIYADIEQSTGASSATISRVNRCLLYGANGYRLALERLKK